MKAAILIDGAYLEMLELERLPRSEAQLPRLCDWTKRQASQFRGATVNTHMRNDGYDFLNLGAYLERGDNTARLLDVKYYVLLPTTAMIGGGVDTYQWTTLLRALSAFRSFHWAYGSQYSPRKIANFLILDRACPRSMLHAQAQVSRHLDHLCEAYIRPTSAQERAKAAVVELGAAQVEDIMQEGLHEFLTRFINQNAAIGQEIAEAYLFGVN